MQRQHNTTILIFYDTLLADIDSIKKFSNTKSLSANSSNGGILFVADIADLLNRGSRLRDIIERFSLKYQFILHIRRNGDFDTLMKCDSTHKLLSQKVANLDNFAITMIS
jgi:hypothetical protein